MARKPNYRFERQERERIKAAKKAAKKEAKAAEKEAELPATGDVGETEDVADEKADA